jgi:hypothetical protein
MIRPSYAAGLNQVSTETAGARPQDSLFRFLGRVDRLLYAAASALVVCVVALVLG